MFTIDGGAGIHWADYLIIFIYFGFVLGVGLWASIRSQRDSVGGYFLASRNMHFVLVGASLFASNIGPGQYIGLAGSGAAAGIAIAGFELMPVVALMMLGWIFSPVYLASGIVTMPEYIHKRFGGQRIRVCLTLIGLLLSIFTKISVDLFAGAQFIKMAMGWSLYPSIMMLLILAALFTIAGGLSAVVWTDFVQIILMIIGAFILMGFTMVEIGGLNNLIVRYMGAEPNITMYDQNGVSCGKSPEYAPHLLRSPIPGEADLPWTGIIFGGLVSSIWYWCTDQVIVQRILASKTMLHAKASAVLACSCKVLPLFLLVFPGMAAKALYPNEVGCVDPDECEKFCGSHRCTDSAYPTLVVRLMPTGLTGLMLAVMMAALMSSLTSIFNSSSALFSIDIWTRIRRKASEYEKLIVGRVFVLVMVGISVLWVPMIDNSPDSQLFNYKQSITAFLCPSVATMYVLAVFFERINEKGAFWSLVAGLVFGSSRFILENVYAGDVPSCGSTEPDTRPQFIKVFVGKIHYLHFNLIVVGLSVIVAFIVSYLTEPIPKKHLHRLTFWSRHSQEIRVDIDSCDTPVKTTPPIREDEEEVASIKKKKASEKEVLPPDSIIRRILNIICGFDTRNMEPDKEHISRLSLEEQAKQDALFLYEDPFKKRIVTIAAVIVATFVAFLWGFFA